MEIQEGRMYRTRGGKIRGPMMEHCASDGELLGFKDALSSKTGFDWYPNGKATSFDEHPMDLVEEVVEPTAWKDLDNAEKGAILLAVYSGDPVEYYVDGEWCNVDVGEGLRRGHRELVDYLSYRIAPRPVEPKVFWEYNGYLYTKESNAKLARRGRLDRGKPDDRPIRKLVEVLE